MWRKCEGDWNRYVNMEHMASITVERSKEEMFGVYANEIGEQSKYLIKSFDTKVEAEKLAEDIVNEVE